MMMCSAQYSSSQTLERIKETPKAIGSSMIAEAVVCSKYIIGSNVVHKTMVCWVLTEMYP